MTIAEEFRSAIETLALRPKQGLAFSRSASDAFINALTLVDAPVRTKKRKGAAEAYVDIPDVLWTLAFAVAFEEVE